jgi:glycosyltransferase involved in cell wall biosynthesis
VVAAAERPNVRGKSLFLGDAKMYVRGVTYGTFGPDEETSDFPGPETVSQDFTRMAAIGVNAVRTYTVPPRWLLDLAHENGLHVMVGLPWEEHITFLDGRERAKAIKERVREGVRSCAGHPAILCYAIGNEIPASIVRWHGRHRIERFLKQLYRAAKEEDPGALVTYVIYPSTEYLQLPFVDLVCFNVFLESGPQFEAYLARLQNLAGDRPLVVTETGLDSRRHSEEAQARALDWQVRSAFAAGSAGVFVFSWTDEWHRGGFEVDDWDFGLVDRHRQPKRALAAVGKAFSELPFPNGIAWPRISVVVCAYNSEVTLRNCFDGLRSLEYPNYEVIIVNDGSTDCTDEIVREYGFHLISTRNRGLASARNAGLEVSTGEIIAYLDADARPDPSWLSHLAVTYMTSSHVGVGGPNIPPPEDPELAECVAHAPGGPTHVLLSDREAEHIPGCNMSFRKSTLEMIGGFDPQFHIAGDDVDICWKIQERGETVGFSAGAVVWHHRRDSVRGYLRQQFEYGKAEALLERKWPDRYNRVGHLAWSGRVYGNGATRALGWRRWKIYYGMWGTGLFQSVYQRNAAFSSLPLVPEWYLVILALVGVSALGILWTPLLLALPVLALAVGALFFEAGLGTARATFTNKSLSRATEWRLRSVTWFLHLLQPLARLTGRLRYGLAPWRRRAGSFAFPRRRKHSIWDERWQSADQRLKRVEQDLRGDGCVVLHGSAFDRWDIEVRGGMLGVARLRIAVEEHGAGRQLVRFSFWPKYSRFGLGLVAACAALALGAAIEGVTVAAAVLATVAAVIGLSAIRDSATATGVLLRALAGRSRRGGRVARARRYRESAVSSLNAKPEKTMAAYLSGNGAANPQSQNGHDAATTPASLSELPQPSGIAPVSSND